MFLFSWTPACPSAWTSFHGGDLAFCFLAGDLEASQIHNTERECAHTVAPSDTSMSHDDLGKLVFIDLQVRGSLHHASSISDEQLAHFPCYLFVLQ